MWSYGRGMMDGYGWGGGFPLLMGLFWLALLGLLVWLLVAAFRRSSSGVAERGRSRALDLLEEAYAKGSIGRDEFLQKKHDLES